MDPRLEAAIFAAREAGAIALRSFRTGLAVERKADQSPVTEADRACERRIVEILRERFPDYGFFGEELGKSEGAGKARWIIDPIDGTKSFIRGIPFFATLIGLEEDGEVTAGVVHAPATGELLYAARGEGAYDETGRRLRVSEITTLDRAMVSFGGMAIFQKEGWWRAFEELVARTARQRGFGDYLGSVMVARGWSEAMLELDVKAWDLAPLKILVEEAGGRFTDFSGRATIHGGSAIVTNGRIHEEVLEILRASKPT
ncbi:MAG: inositol monophosphatase family protein, partial [Candidatus Binatia bacterium]